MVGCGKCRQRMENIDKLKEDPNYGFSSSDGLYFVQSKDIKNCIDEVGGYASLETDFLQESDDPDDWETYLRILETLSEFAFDIIQGTRNIVSERDSRGGPANEEIPPVLPIDLSQMDVRDFRKELAKNKTRLENHFSSGANVILMIEEEFRKLREDYRDNKTFRSSLEAAASNVKKQSFEEAWKPATGFPTLKMYCGCLASVMPGTSSVEADFSIIHWTKDPNTSSLTDFSLESILHCKQHKRLKMMCQME